MNGVTFLPELLKQISHHVTKSIVRKIAVRKEIFVLVLWNFEPYLHIYETDQMNVFQNQIVSNYVLLLFCLSYSYYSSKDKKLRRNQGKTYKYLGI